MLTREDDIDVHALRRQGWTISAIARHLGRDRKTIRGYLAGEHQAGVRAPRVLVDPFEAFAPYCAQRLADDPHLWAMTLFDELGDLGYPGSYPTMTRQLRLRALRPACEPCRPATGRPIAVIDHPAGEETQWDWVELPDPPPAWGWGKTAHLLVGALSHCDAAKTHGRLAPYIDKQVSRAVKTDEPIMKPLFFNYPADQSTYTIDNEWLLGDSLLAAPILSDGTSRNIHLPAGKWFDVTHHRVLAGPVDLTGYTADLTQTPTFIRLGTPDTGMLMRALG